MCNLHLQSWPSRILLLFILSIVAWLPLSFYGYHFKRIPTYVAPISAEKTILESEHIVLKAPKEYMKESRLISLMTRTEQTLSDLSAFLDQPPLDGKVTIHLMEGWGISRIGGTKYILWYMAREGHIPIAHELTHILMGDSPSRLLLEGLAVYNQDRFGDYDFPILYSTSDLATLGQIRRGSFMHLDNLSKGIGFQGESRRLAYVESGSFASYLITRFGLPKYKEIYYSNDYQEAYGQTLIDLERGWIEQLWLKNLIVTAVYMITGFLCLYAMSVALTKESPWWFLFVALIPQAFVVLDLFLYFRFSSRLAIFYTILALLTVPLDGKVPTKWIRLMIWIVGLSLLVYSQVLATIDVSKILMAARSVTMFESEIANWTVFHPLLSDPNMMSAYPLA